MLANCNRDESCTGKLATIFPKGPKFVAQTDFCVHRSRIWINGIKQKFISLIFAGKFRRGLTERFRLKTILTSSEYTVIQQLPIT